MSLALENHSAVVIAGVGFAAIYILYRTIQSAILAYKRSILKKEKGCKPPPRYAHADPIFGMDTFLESFRKIKTGGIPELIRERYDRVSKRCGGPRHTFTSIFTTEIVIQTREPENVKAVLATQFKDFSLPESRKEAFAEIFGHGIFTTDGKEWEESRALLRPNFNRSQVGDIEVLEEHISKMIARIPKDGSTVDLQVLFFMLTMDSATEFLFGQSANSLGVGTEHKEGVKFAEAFTYSTERTGIVSRFGPLARFMKDKKYMDDVKFVHRYVSSYVQKAVRLSRYSDKQDEHAGEKSRYVFLEELAKTGYSEKKIQDELLNILLAGRDTTAGLLSYVWYTLARNPRVFKKLRREVLEMGEGRPTFEQIKSCKYLQWTLNEALRLYPIVPMNSRVAVVDTTLPTGGGPDGKSPVFVKKGQLVVYQVSAMHRRKDLYGEDADEFKPERWETFRPGWQYLPFNGGPRICIGQQFALIEASYTTIRLLQQFKEIEPRENSELKELFTLTVTVRQGVKVGLTPA